MYYARVVNQSSGPRAAQVLETRLPELEANLAKAFTCATSIVALSALLSTTAQTSRVKTATADIAETWIYGSYAWNSPLHEFVRLAVAPWPSPPACVEPLEPCPPLYPLLTVKLASGELRCGSPSLAQMCCRGRGQTDATLKLFAFPRGRRSVSPISVASFGTWMYADFAHAATERGSPHPVGLIA